jgi:hypothetical protein
MVTITLSLVRRPPWAPSCETTIASERVRRPSDVAGNVLLSDHAKEFSTAEISM